MNIDTELLIWFQYGLLLFLAKMFIVDSIDTYC